MIAVLCLQELSVELFVPELSGNGAEHFEVLIGAAHHQNDQVHRVATVRIPDHPLP